MARRRPIEYTPPAASSSEEEKEENDQENDDDSTQAEDDTAEPQNGAVKDQQSDGSDDEEEEENDDDVGANKESSAPKQTLNPSEIKSDSSTDSETDSDSDRPSAFAIKPIQSKQPSTPLKSTKSAPKRPAEPDPAPKDLKKKKVEDESVKKAFAIQRLFSEEDEVALLEGIIDFQSKKGIDPYSDIGKFHEFIKKSIHFDASANQLKEKIRRLKNKYQTLVKKSGEDPVISKPHDLKVFNLSKKFWGGNNNTNVVEKAKKSAKTKKESGDDGGVGGGITLALASKGDDAITTKRQKKVANAGGVRKAEPGLVKGNNAGVESEEEEEEDRMVVDEQVGAAEEDDLSVKYPLCVGGLMEAVGLPEKTRSYYVQNLGLIGKEKLEEYEAKLEKIKWAELELFIQKRELVNEKLRLLRDASKRNQ